MKDRKQKVEELLTGFRTLRRGTSFGSAGSAKGPRITPAQWGVLMHVEQHEKSTVKDLSQTFKISSSASTQLVDGLVKSGYLTRTTSPEDRRIVTLTLSKKSKKQIDTMKQQIVKKFLKIFEVLNDREFDQYLALNKKLVMASSSKKSSL
jgi:MarR family transcriptional regulator, organic hydroperoxide resistance regulator